jgi:beta-mannanase
MRKRKLVIACLLILSLFIVSVPNVDASDWAHYQRGVELLNEGRVADAIKELEQAAAISEKASTLRKLAEAYEIKGNFQKAAETYYREAEVHKKRGATNTYLATKNKADALNTEIEIFTETKGASVNHPLAKYEPSNGMYFGAYIEQDEIRSHGSNKYNAFNEKTGKQHSIFFKYHNYGDSFPSSFAENVRNAGAAVHLAFEPNNGLDEVTDNHYLRQFAKDAKESGVPIFLRFASEMNGDWTAWSKNPSEYIKKFRVVSQVMKEEAPNVVLVWVPNSVPVHNITDYYPGDEWVDWVGVNLYSVPYFNGNANEPADHVNPLDLLDYVYDTYADRKPVMIGEYGASHFTSVGNNDVTKFSITKMNLFYHGLKMKYPRVKAVHWFSVDTLNANFVNRRLNNFSLTENGTVLNSYKSIINDDYFLSDVVNGPNVENQSLPGKEISTLQGQTIRDSVKGLGFVKSYDPYISKVVYRLNGSYLSEQNQYPFGFKLDYQKLKAGTNKLEAVVFDSKGRQAGRKTVTFTKGAQVGTIGENQLKMYINNRSFYTSKGKGELLAAPYIKAKRTMVPLRFVSETLGATVNWNSQLKKITISNDSRTIILHKGSKKVLSNGETHYIEAPPEIITGTTFVPLRFISEHLGAKVQYESQDRSISVAL